LVFFCSQSKKGALLSFYQPIKGVKMRKVLVMTALFLFVVIGKITAQSLSEEKPFRIGASLGYSFSGYREETYAPVNRYLNNLTFIIDGNIEKGNFFHSLNTGFFMGNAEMDGGEKAILRQDYDPQKGEAYYLANIQQYLYIRGYLEYALDYRLWGTNVFPGFLGGSFRADAYIQFAHYPSITGLFSLDLHASQKWIINPENKLSLSIGVPLFGYAVRPAYAGADYALIQYSAQEPLKVITLGEIVSLHNYWAVFGDLKCHHKINSLLSLYSGLGFELSRINFPRPRTDAIFRLNSGIAFTF
jgi:hypothetical protein